VRLIAAEPRVKPNYKVEPSKLLLVILIPLALASLILGLLMESLGFVAAALYVTVSVLSSVIPYLRGNYSLAVSAVNSVSIEEWAYNRGVAVLKLLSQELLVLDTRSKVLMLFRSYMLRRKEGSSRSFLRFKAPLSVRGKPYPMYSDVEVPPGAKGIKVLRGEFTVPSLESSSVELWGYGLVFKVKLSEKCVKDLGKCLPQLLDALKAL